MTIPSGTPYQVPDFGKTLRDTLIVAGQQQLQGVLKEQPWYKRYSNTLVAFSSALTAFLVWAGGNSIALPDYVTVVVGVLLVALQTLGIRATPNGVTPSTVQQVINPQVWDAISAEAEKFITSQLEAAYYAQPPTPSSGEHRA
jgi:hypothetical protein